MISTLLGGGCVAVLIFLVRSNQCTGSSIAHGCGLVLVVYATVIVVILARADQQLTRRDRDCWGRTVDTCSAQRQGNRGSKSLGSRNHRLGSCGLSSNPLSNHGDGAGIVLVTHPEVSLRGLGKERPHDHAKEPERTVIP